MTDVEKARIPALREEKVPIKEIVRRTGKGKSTIMRLLATACEFPPNVIPQYNKRPGRTRKTPLTDHLLKLAVNRNPRLTAEDLKKLYSKLLFAPSNTAVNITLSHQVSWQHTNHY